MRLSNPLISSVRVSASRAWAAISAASASKSSSPPSDPHSRSVVAAASMTASARSSAHAWRLQRQKNAARRALPRRLTWTGLAYRAKNRSAVNVISEPSAAIHAGPRISSSASRRAMHAVRPLGVQKGKPGKHFGVEPISLGVLVVVITQISGLLGWHHHHRRAVAAEPGRQRDPGVAGRLHHHLDPLGVFWQPRPQRVQLVWVGAKPVTHEQESSLLVCQRCLMRSTASYVDSQANFQSRAFPYRWIWLSAQGKTTPTRSASTRHSLSGIRSSPPTLGHRVLNRAHDPRCGTRPPTHSTRQKSARALLRLSYRGDGRAPANSV